jgi:L-fuconate dehydratase
VTVQITGVATIDARFTLKPGEGSDAVHTDPQYAYAVTRLTTDRAMTGTGFVLTLGLGNDLVNSAIEFLAEPLIGRDIDEVMGEFGMVQRAMADHAQLRWLGPHKGVVHLALASITNACFDLWAKSRGVPLWSLLLDLTPDQVVSLLDLSYLEDVLTAEQARTLIVSEQAGRMARSGILHEGYPGYDTSIGWFGYSDERLVDNAKRAVGEGFDALKLKVGSDDPDRDVRRATLLREAVGANVRLMVDANQQWSVPQAEAICARLRDVDLFWVEEPTHPDDVLAHRHLAKTIAPTRIALGEHVPNRIVFKNYIKAQSVHFVQVDCTRVAGVSEFLTVSLLARQAGLPVVPHVGDMGQVHQHLVLFNHIALNNEVVFLEHIPHLAEYFVHPAIVRDGHYVTPQEPGASADFLVYTVG